MSNLKRRILTALSVFFVLNAVGVLGYWYLAEGDATFVDAMYMTATTLGSVGFGEITKNSNAPSGRAFTIVLIYANMVTLVFVTTSLTAFLLEGELLRILEKRRMDKRLESLKDHFIVCGGGSTGVHVVKELYLTERPVVIIEASEERARHLLTEVQHAGQKKTGLIAYVIGDATDDLILAKAGLERAAGLVAALPNDKDNLFITITARQMAPQIRIIARASELQSIEKLKRSGAHSVVSPNMIGGLRMVSELVRPNVVTFLDLMLRDKDKAMRIEEVQLAAANTHVGKALETLDALKRFQCSVLAVRAAGRADFTYNPEPETVLDSGMTLVVLGSADRVSALRQACT